ncbi:solute carrier family 2, facilitated glucose transporter member 6 isoform X1 [Halyomorpha halys]|uniref:solute carrier family 2, facilitated glucose transporter member 6 isoform X1 n=2 Tax=Halyomorpha halys TaxID=286706 RepID=UPI0006D50C65
MALLYLMERDAHYRVYFYFSCYLSMVMAGVAMVWPSPLTAWFSSKNSEVPMTQDEVSWMVSIGPIGAGFSAIPSGILADRYGRKPVLLCTGVLSTICWTMIVSTRTKWTLYGAQVLGGVVVGGLVCVAPIYLSEISPPDIRGAIVGQLSTMSFVGQLIVYAVGPHLTYTHYVWVCFSIPLFFLITFILAPESPYYLMSKGKEQEAKESMLKLRGTEYLMEVESSYFELHSNSNMLPEKSLWEALKQDGYMKYLICLVILSGVSQMDGNATISVYGEEFIGGQRVILVMGIVFVVTSFFASFLTDPFGRRPLLICSLIGSAISTSLLTAYFVTHNDGLLYSGMFGFCVISSLGINPIILTLPSELFPTRLRALANGLTQLVASIVAFVTLKIFIPINAVWGIEGNFIIYTVVSLIGAVSAALLPETAKTTISSS